MRAHPNPPPPTHTHTHTHWVDHQQVSKGCGMKPPRHGDQIVASPSLKDIKTGVGGVKWSVLGGCSWWLWGVYVVVGGGDLSGGN